MPLVDNELNELSGADGMMGAAGEKDYAELSHDVNDIFETDNCKCYNHIACSIIVSRFKSKTVIQICFILLL